MKILIALAFLLAGCQAPTKEIAECYQYCKQLNNVCESTVIEAIFDSNIKTCWCKCIFNFPLADSGIK